MAKLLPTQRVLQQVGGYPALTLAAPFLLRSAGQVMLQWQMIGYVGFGHLARAWAADS